MNSFFDLTLKDVVEIFLAGALVFVGASQLIYSGQLTIMQSDHRPWAAVSGNITASSDLAYGNGNGNLDVKFQIRNYSKTPASGIFATVGAYVNRNAAGLDVALREFCMKAKRGDPITNTEGGIIWPENVAGAERQIVFESPKDALTNVFVMVCVAYKAPDDITVHASGNTFLAVRRDPQSGVSRGLGPGGDLVRQGDIGFGPSLPGYAD